MTDITERLRELSKARWDKDAWERETTVRIPAEPDRDIDLVLANAAAEIDRLRARVVYLDQQRTGMAIGLDVRDEKIDMLRARVAELEAERDAAFKMSRCECDSDEACRNLAALHRRVAELEAERADDDALRERMSDILKRTAIALRGPEPPLTAWSWHDLPERAAAAIASIDLFQRVAHNLADPRGLVPMLVDRFLCWKLPDDFAPDCGITFKRESDYEHPVYGRTKYEPVGTNLFTAVQATAMFEHLLGIDPPAKDGVELIDGNDCTCSVIQAAHGHHAGCPAKDGA